MDAEPRSGSDDVARGSGPGAVAYAAGQSLRCGPAAVAVGDDSHVEGRNRWLCERGDVASGKDELRMQGGHKTSIGFSGTKYSVLQSTRTKKIFSAFSGRADQRFHVVQIAFQGTPPRGGQAVLGLWQTAVKGLGTGDVIRLFELPGMDAQVAIGSLEQGLKFIEGLRTVDGQGADDAQANAFMDQAVEIGGNRLTSAGRALPRCRTIFLCGRGG